MMSLLKEFREFALKGNVVDLAVGVIIGAAFGAIVTSVVNDVMMPPLGWLTGGLDFKDKVWTIQRAGDEHLISGNKLDKDVIVSYGKFVNAAIQFTITAIAIFALVKFINIARRKPEPPPPTPPAPSREEALLMEIRDAILANSQQ
jgi:large conductance mechanosensitive channel